MVPLLKPSLFFPLVPRCSSVRCICHFFSASRLSVSLESTPLATRTLLVWLATCSALSLARYSLQGGAHRRPAAQKDTRSIARTYTYTSQQPPVLRMRGKSRTPVYHGRTYEKLYYVCIECVEMVDSSQFSALTRKCMTFNATFWCVSPIQVRNWHEQ